ncbi:MAG TPA: HD domain-containing protein [Candidatus Paceibacterota bacterium]
MNKRDLEFLYEIGTLRNMDRAWKTIMATDVASDPEHTFRVIFLALLIARSEGVKNEEKIIKMALVHDIAEVRTNDHHYLHSVYVKADEHKASYDTFFGTSLADLNSKVLSEYEERKTIESKIVKDADNLDIDLELKEMDERGLKLPAKFVKFRKLVRDKKLYTKSAKKLWDMIQKSDPADWHLKANKWVKLPKAGK